MTEVIVLNGGSSSGKSGIVRCLQAVLPDPWLALGTDTLVDAMPASMQASDAGIEFAPDGEVIVGPEFRTLEAAWLEGVAAMARAGARVIVDEVFLGGAASQRRWQQALGGLRLGIDAGLDPVAELLDALTGVFGMALHRLPFGGMNECR